MIDPPEVVHRAQEYCRRTGLNVGPQLGFGLHGIVCAAENQTNVGRSAIKAHEYGRYYQRERDVYLRLADAGVSSILGCAVPEMLRYDDELLVIEMTVVTPPYVLDFAGAYLDEPPEFSEEVMADWYTEKAEQFGPNWTKVQAVLHQLEVHGVFLLDVSPSNVCLE